MRCRHPMGEAPFDDFVLRDGGTGKKHCGQRNASKLGHAILPELILLLIITVYRGSAKTFAQALLLKRRSPRGAGVSPNTYRRACGPSRPRPCRGLRRAAPTTAG